MPDQTEPTQNTQATPAADDAASTEPVATATDQADTSQPAEPTGQQVSDEPHPLEPGGKRFSEVYRDMREAQREAMELREQLARQQAQAQAVAQPREVWYTADQLQELVNAGRITQAQAADQLAWQRATLQSREDAVRRQAELIQAEAAREIQQYTSKIPALLTPGSAELVKVGRVAAEIGRDLGLDVRDLRVQKMALRQVYGSPDRLGRVTQAKEDARRNADTHAETDSGGGPRPAAKDPLAHVPQRYIDHWKRLNYTREQMIAESKYIRVRTRS